MGITDNGGGQNVTDGCVICGLVRSKSSSNFPRHCSHRCATLEKRGYFLQNLSNDVIAGNPVVHRYAFDILASWDKTDKTKALLFTKSSFCCEACYRRRKATMLAIMLDDLLAARVLQLANHDSKEDEIYDEIAKLR